MMISMFIPKILKAEKRNEGVYKVMTVFSNIGFMGFPIISSIYGNGALLYASIFLLPYNFLIYTYGIKMMKPSEMAQKETQSNLLAQIKDIFNIGVISGILAIIIFMLNIKLPNWMQTCITMLSNLTAPLSMMVIGASFAVIDLKGMVTDVRLIVFSIMKQLIIPIIGIFIIKQTISNEVLAGVIMIMLAVPVGSMTAMLAQEYEGDYELTSKGVALTTLMSVVTIPIIANLFNLIG